MESLLSRRPIADLCGLRHSGRDMRMGAVFQAGSRRSATVTIGEPFGVNGRVDRGIRWIMIRDV